MAAGRSLGQQRRGDARRPASSRPRGTARAPRPRRDGAGSRRPNPTGPEPAIRPWTDRASRAAWAAAWSRSRRGQDGPLAIVDPLLDVEREDVPAAGRPDAEGDGDGVVRLVGDRQGDPAHPELLRPGGGTTVQAHGRLPRRQALDLDVLPADAPDAEAQDLADGLLGGPPSGERLGPIAHIASFVRGQDAVREARAEAGDRRPDPVHLDDVDAELGRARGDEPGGIALVGRARVHGPYSTVTDLARLRGWSTSVPRATAM